MREPSEPHTALPLGSVATNAPEHSGDAYKAALVAVVIPDR